jgi:hypothetical protein
MPPISVIHTGEGAAVCRNQSRLRVAVPLGSP